MSRVILLLAVLQGFACAAALPQPAPAALRASLEKAEIDFAATVAFLNLGGRSLLAAQLRNQIHATLEVDLPLQSLFETPTVAAVAARIEGDRRRSTEGAADKPIAERLRNAFPTDRQEILEQLSSEAVAS